MFMCFLRKCTLAIADALKLARPDVQAPGADELLPMMVLALQQAKPRGLHSCIQYIQRYTPRARLDSEAGYLLTHLMSAVQFLERADESMLTISPREFEHSMQACHREAQSRLKKITSGSLVSAVSAAQQNESIGFAGAAANPSTVRNRSASTEQSLQRKQRSATASSQVQQLTAPTGLFSSALEEQLFVEALASAADENELRAVWAKYRKASK